MKFKLIPGELYKIKIPNLVCATNWNCNGPHVHLHENDLIVYLKSIPNEQYPLDTDYICFLYKDKIILRVYWDFNNWLKKV